MCNRLLSFSNKPLKKEDEIKEYKEELSRNIYLISKSLNPKRVSYLFRILHSPLNNNIFPPFVRFFSFFFSIILSFLNFYNFYDLSFSLNICMYIYIIFLILL